MMKKGTFDLRAILFMLYPIISSLYNVHAVVILQSAGLGPDLAGIPVFMIFFFRQSLKIFAPRDHSIRAKLILSGELPVQ
jgi:hypothetical protein